ncbi:MAG TPA: hypothetical protein VEU33_35020 [Archangium sp.]|nr:hypothetical protein [Archangium sp.]
MSLRFIPCCVLVAGIALLGSGCSPTADAADQSAALTEVQEGEKKSCTGREPGYTYVSRDPAECPAIFFTCPDGQSAFFNDCGCGCKTNACNYNDPSRTYVSQDPNQCAVIRFTCPEGQSAFFDDCGCGCTTAP